VLRDCSLSVAAASAWRWSGRPARQIDDRGLLNRSYEAQRGRCGGRRGRARVNVARLRRHVGSFSRTPALSPARSRRTSSSAVRRRGRARRPRPRRGDGASPRPSSPRSRGGSTSAGRARRQRLARPSPAAGHRPGPRVHPAVLVLDEATSSVDAESEARSGRRCRDCSRTDEPHDRAPSRRSSTPTDPGLHQAGSTRRGATRPVAARRPSTADSRSFQAASVGA